MKVATDPKAADKALKRYCDLMADGKGTKAALEATGLSHAQADLAWYGDPRNPNHVVPNSVKLPEVPDKDSDGYIVALRRRGLMVAEMRVGEHTSHKGKLLSWGQIAVVAGLTESAVRAAFKATGIDSAGTRKGRGGRWLSDEPRFYTGNRKAIGVEDAAPRRLNPTEVMATSGEAKSVLPAATQKLRTQLRGKAKARARKATTARKAVAAAE